MEQGGNSLQGERQNTYGARC